MKPLSMDSKSKVIKKSLNVTQFFSLLKCHSSFKYSPFFQTLKDNFILHPLINIYCQNTKQIRDIKFVQDLQQTYQNSVKVRPDYYQR